MASKLEKIEKLVGKLTEKERARLAHDLILSLDDENTFIKEEEHNQVWLAEIERRSEELNSGKIKAIPAAKVLKNSRSRLK